MAYTIIRISLAKESSIQSCASAPSPKRKETANTKYAGCSSPAPAQAEGGKTAAKAGKTIESETREEVDAPGRKMRQCIQHGHGACRGADIIL